MGRILAGALAIIVIIGGAYWIINSQTMQPEEQVQQSTPTITWNISELPEKDGIPRSSVTLAANGKVYQLGEFDGSCFEVDASSWPLMPGEIAGVICWFAGGGSEVGVFEEGGSYVIKVGILEEGTAEIEGFRGDFQTIASIE